MLLVLICIVKSCVFNKFCCAVNFHISTLEVEYGNTGEVVDRD